MSLHVNDFMKISKALESSYQRLLSENSLETDCLERINVAKDEYTKAMIHATFDDMNTINLTRE